MTIERNFFIMCENIILGDQGKISFINLYDRIFAEKVPAFHSKLSFALNLNLRDVKKTDKTIAVELQIESPSGKSVLRTPLVIQQPINTELSDQNVGFAMEVNGFAISEFGIYKAKVLANGINIPPLLISVEKRAQHPTKN